MEAVYSWEIGEVAPGVHRVVMEPALVSCIIITSGDDAVIVDPGTFPSRAKDLRTYIEQRGYVIQGVFITHADWDHALGLGAFEDVPSFASPLAIERLRDHGDAVVDQARQMLGEDAMEDYELAELNALRVSVPTHPITDDQCVELGEVALRTRECGRAHSGGDIIVDVPSAGASIVGDLIETADDPWVDEFSDPRAWLDVLGLIDTHCELILIPGHGEIVGPDPRERRDVFEGHRRVLQTHLLPQ